MTQLYTRHLYALIDSVWTLNCWVVLSEGAISELLFWQGLPKLRFAGPIWPPTGGGLDPIGVGRQRFRLGRPHDAGALLGRTRVLVGGGVRDLFDLSGAPRRDQVPPGHDARL